MSTPSCSIYEPDVQSTCVQNQCTNSRAVMNSFSRFLAVLDIPSRVCCKIYAPCRDELFSLVPNTHAEGQ